MFLGVGTLSNSFLHNLVFVNFHNLIDTKTSFRSVLLVLTLVLSYTHLSITKISPSEIPFGAIQEVRTQNFPKK